MSQKKPYTDLDQQIAHLIEGHFEQAKGRVDDVYLQHFASARGVLGRHWQYRQDIPRDLLSLPRSVWRLGTGAAGSIGNRLLPPYRHHKDSSQREDSSIAKRDGDKSPVSAKEQAVQAILMQDLMQLPQLEWQLYQLIQRQLAEAEPAWQHWEQQLQQTLHGYDGEQAKQRIAQAVSHLSVSHEGGREALLFISLGLLGKTVSDKVAFGSALGLGSSAATGFYLSQQSLLGGLWAGWFGVPAWVTVSGAVGGLLVVTAITPVVAPFSELAVNRLRGRKFLLQIIEKVQDKMLSDKPDAATMAGYVATYVQFLPDLIQALRVMK